LVNQDESIFKLTNMSQWISIKSPLHCIMDCEGVQYYALQIIELGISCGGSQQYLGSFYSGQDCL